MSDERRNVAERLREVALHPDVDGEVWGSDVLAALGVAVDDGYVVAESVVDLADLIDPTCVVRMPLIGSVGVCSRCGALVETRSAVFSATEALPTRYCPNCGARVVTDDD